MHDDDFEALLQKYGDPAGPRPSPSGPAINWIFNDPDAGLEHIRYHGLSREDVEDVLFGAAPEVEVKRHKDYPDRTIFWGPTRWKQWIFVCCADTVLDGKRILTPITAFEPDDGRQYWERS